MTFCQLFRNICSFLIMQSMQLLRRLLPTNVSSRHRRLAHASSTSFIHFRPLVERIQVALDAAPDPVNSKRMFLVDAMDPINRSHYALSERHLSTSGEDVTILYGFLKHLFAVLLTKPSPEFCIVVFDAPGADFRCQIYSAYKAQRPPSPVEVLESIPLIQEALDLLGIKWVMVHSIEADDSIAVLANRSAKEGIYAHIISRDKDFFQILDERIALVRGPLKPEGKFTKYTPGVFRKEFGFEPRNYVDKLALEGDSTDNVPGVKQIGPKRASELVQQFGDIDSIFKHASEVESTQVRKCLMDSEAKPSALLSRDLVALAVDLKLPPLRFPLEDARIKVSKREEGQFLQFLQRMNIHPLDREVYNFFKLFSKSFSG